MSRSTIPAGDKSCSESVFKLLNVPEGVDQGRSLGNSQLRLIDRQLTNSRLCVINNRGKLI